MAPDEHERSPKPLHDGEGRLHLLAEVATDLLRLKDPERLLDGVFTHLRKQAKIELCLCYLVERSRLRLIFAGGIENQSLDDQCLRDIEWLSVDHPVFGVAALGDSHLWTKVSADSKDPVILLACSRQIGGLSCYPLRSDSKFLGALAFGTKFGSVPDPEQFDLEHIIADQIALAFDRSFLVSELAKNNEELAAANVELKQVNLDLEQLAFCASHDLREPLRHLSIYSEILQNKMQAGLYEEALECLGYIITGARRMDALVRDLVSYTQVGKEPVPMANVNINEVLDEVVMNLQPFIHETRAVIHSDALPVIRANYKHLLLLFQHLMENALKYHRAGAAPEIRIHSERDGDNDIVINVQDNGIGIAPEHQTRIFGLFKRLHAAHEYEGTGIGLAICKKIVEQYRGRIWVESQPGEGAVFCFKLGKPLHDYAAFKASSGVSS